MTTAPDGYFALDRIAAYAGTSGYVVDKDMYVYSAKRKGAPHLMACTHGVIKLASFGGCRSLTIEHVRNSCYISEEFQAWQRKAKDGIWSSQAALEKKVGDYQLAPNCGWIIGTMGSKGLEFSSAPVVHSSLSSVRIECARIAKLVPGTQVVYLEIKGSCQSSGVTWA